ncbi:MAG TPA: HlyD family secretion protein [Verrucomicrobiae bacterium]|nr:HlyD family secretion protein [Verrucomicrobiae bacterium]
MNAQTLSAMPEAPVGKDVKLPPSRPTQPILEDQETELLPANNRRRFSLKQIAIIVLILIIGVVTTKFACDWWTVGRFVESTDDAYVGGDVTVIAPEVAGFVKQVAVTDNQSVHAGDLLIKLDDRDYRAVLAKADAAVALQQATLTNLDATRHLQAAVIAQAQAEIAATDAETSRAHDDQVRFQKLLGTGAISIQGFQQADANYKLALAAGAKAQATLEAAQRQLDVIATQKMQAQAALQQVIAQRESAQLNLGYTELRAPIDGVIGNRSAQIGAYATTGSQLISLVPSHGLWVDANFKENQLVNIRPGSPATVKVDSLPGQIFHGHVASVSPATGAQFSVLPPENATGNFTKIVQRVAVRIVLDDSTAALDQLRAGLSVTAKVDTRSTVKSAL